MSGLGTALTDSGIFALLSVWCPYKERTVTIACIWTGMSLGNAIGTILAGTIAQNSGNFLVIYNRMENSILYIWFISTNLGYIVDDV